jgi:L,D-transpeptidase catalytic domain
VPANANGVVKVMHNGSQVWTTKVVIGDPSPGKQTPLLSETMKSITVNPNPCCRLLFSFVDLVRSGEPL